MSGELKLSLENFQSISSGELVFEKGLNFIIGQSNSGKSATFRALKACLSNPIGSQRFIKKGTKKASVCLTYEGNEIIWNRTSKESSYTINGEDYLKTGKSNAFKILENSHIGFVRDDNDTIMNIEEELQLPFPFGLSEFELFKLYENVFCVSDSAVILKGAKEQEESVKSEIASLELELTKGRVKLNNVLSFKEYVDLDVLKGFKSTLQSRKERLSVLSEGRELIDQAVKLDKVDSSFNECSFDNLLVPLKEKREVKRALVRTKKAHQAGKILQELNIDIEDLTDKYSDLNELRVLRNKVKELGQHEIPEKEFISALNEYNSLLDLKETLEQIKSVESFSIPSFELDQKLDRYKELIETKNLVTSIKESLAKGKAEYEKLQEVIKDKEDKLKEFKVCPLCQRAME